MLIRTIQMRAPSKRWLAIASILVISLASLAWSFNRLRLGAGDSEGAPASLDQKAVIQTESVNTDSARLAEAKWIDSDNDGLPDVAELRTFQDRANDTASPLPESSPATSARRDSIASSTEAKEWSSAASC